MAAIFNTIFLLFLVVLVPLTVVIGFMRSAIIEEIKQCSPIVDDQSGRLSSLMSTQKRARFGYQFIMTGKYQHVPLDDALKAACRRLALLLYVQHAIGAGFLLILVIAVLR